MCHCLMRNCDQLKKIRLHAGCDRTRNMYLSSYGEREHSKVKQPNCIAQIAETPS